MKGGMTGKPGEHLTKMNHCGTIVLTSRKDRSHHRTEQAGSRGGHDENEIIMAKVKECSQLLVQSNCILTNMSSVEKIWQRFITGHLLGEVIFLVHCWSVQAVILCSFVLKKYH